MASLVPIVEGHASNQSHNYENLRGNHLISQLYHSTSVSYVECMLAGSSLECLAILYEAGKASGRWVLACKQYVIGVRQRLSLTCKSITKHLY